MKTPVIVASVATVVIALGAGTWYYVDQRIRSEVDTRLATAVEQGQYEALHYEDLGYTLDGSITITGLHVQQSGTQYRLGQITVSKLDYRETFPSQVELTIRGLEFPAGLPDLSGTDNARLGELLARIATDDGISLEVDYSHDYQPENAHQLQSDLAVRVPALMNLAFSGSLRKLPIDTLTALANANTDPQGDQQRWMALVSEAEVPELALSIEDIGLVQALLEISAAQFNAQPDVYRSMLISQARNAYLFLPQNAQQLGMDTGAELADFLEGGRTLTLTVEPEFEGSIGQLQSQMMGAMLIGDFTRMAELLNFQLDTN